MKKLSLLFSLALLSALAPHAMAVEVQGLDNPDVIPGQFIIKTKKAKDWKQFAEGKGGKLVHGYGKSFNGLALKADAAALKKIAEDPDVEAIYADSVVRKSFTQYNATHGIDRVDSRSGRDSQYNYTQTGSRVHMYVIDTGIRATHSEFAGRMSSGYTAIYDGRGWNDCDGHGTHVAGSAAGKLYGVAKGAYVHSVRVLDCNGSGTASGVIKGIDWVGAQTVRPAVANMSLGGGASLAIDDAVKRAVAKGISFAVAAGNEFQNACYSSPARAADAVTVGAINRLDDNLAYFSNYGSCVDISAPGVDIVSAGITSDTALDTMSGTSMASPHVAGAMALILSEFPTYTPAQVTQTLIARSTQNLIGNTNGTPNRVLYTLSN